jgi:hypothetical protein
MVVTNRMRFFAGLGSALLMAAAIGVNPAAQQPQGSGTLQLPPTAQRTGNLP